MAKIEKQALINRMKGLQQDVPDIQAAAVVSTDGLIMASALPDTVSESGICQH